jgi:Holliday junction DNA helicase RuvA
MIAFLNGVVDSLLTSSLLVDVCGVGYEVFVPMSVLSRATVGEKQKIYTYQHVREDDLRLFGFLSLNDLEIFKLLISVNGIGPKAGLAILSTYSAADIISAVQRGDDRLFASVSGIGKKGAAKIVIELKGKLPEMSSHFVVAGDVQNSLPLDTSNDLVDALVGLGYSEREIYARIKEVDGSLDFDKQIKQMLRLLSRAN